MFRKFWAPMRAPQSTHTSNLLKRASQQVTQNAAGGFSIVSRTIYEDFTGVDLVIIRGEPGTVRRADELRSSSVQSVQKARCGSPSDHGDRTPTPRIRPISHQPKSCPRFAVLHSAAEVCRHRSHIKMADCQRSGMPGDCVRPAA
jgi:hypothetical protein